MHDLPKNCSDVRGSLPLFVGRDLEPAEIDAVQGHLAECADCRTELEATESARRALLSLHAASDLPAEPAAGADEPEFDLWPNIEKELVLRGQIQTAETVVARPRFALLKGGNQRWIAAAAAAFLLAWFGFFTNTQEPLVDPVSPTPLAGETPRTQGQPIQATPVGGPSANAGVLVVNTTATPMDTSELIEDNCSGGLRRIDPSEALGRRATIFAPDVPAFRPFGRRILENPNAAVGQY